MSATRPVELGAVLFLASAGALFVVLMAFFTERAWGTEERTLYNIPYTFQHYGQVAFPAYGYWYHASYDRLFVHPPTHYLAVGILMKLGIPLYYAEAIPLAALAILCLLIIAAGGFPTAMQLGLLAGVLSGVGWVATMGAGDYAFHLRPDAHMAIALLAGLLMLESARISQWDPKRLFAGALLVTYGATVHYPGSAGWLGIFVYAFLAWRELGWRRVRLRLTLITLGGCLAGVPYLVLHVIRNWHYIVYVLSAQPKHTLAQIVQDNFPIYREMTAGAGSFPWHTLFYAIPLKLAFRFGIPPFALAAALLIWRRQTAAMIVAALPVPICLFFLFGRKLFPYYYLESFLVLIGFWILIAALCMHAAKMVRRPWAEASAALIFAGLFAAAFAFATPALRTAQLKPRVHEFQLDRAAAKQVVGPNAIVASIHSLWYLGGGTHWFDLTNDLLRRLPSIDLATYFSRFDAIAVPDRGFFGSTTGLTEASLYAKGIVRLRGFEESGVSPGFKWIWFTARADRPVRGFFWRGQALWGFQDAASGDHVVVTSVVPLPLAQLDSFAREMAPLDYWAAELPSNKPGDADAFVVVMLLDAERFTRLRATVFAKYAPIEVIHGTIHPVDTAALARQVDERNETVTFPRSYAEALPLLVKTPLPTAIRPITGFSSPSQQFQLSAGDVLSGPWRVEAQSVTKQWLATAELPELVKDGWYLVSLDLDIRSGGAAAFVLQDGQSPLVVIDREVPQHAVENFVFRFPGGPPATLVLSAWNPFGPGKVALTIRSATVAKVELSR